MDTWIGNRHSKKEAYWHSTDTRLKLAVTKENWSFTFYNVKIPAPKEKKFTVW